MELRHLRTFVAVADTLNISEAARRLRVTQPALSRHIRDLEHTVGHPLFLRQANGLKLTETGASLRLHGGKALVALDDALQTARVRGGAESAILRVGYYGSVCIWANLLAPAFEKFSRKFPAILPQVVESSSGQLASDLDQGRLDAALLGPGDYSAFPGVAVEVVCSVPAVAMVAINHRLAKKRAVTLEDLRLEEIIGIKPTIAPGRDRAFLAACHKAGFAPRIAPIASSLSELMMSVTKRMGVAILGSFATSAPHPGIVFLKVNAPELRLDIHAAYSRQSPPAAKCLVDFAVAEGSRALLAA